MKKSIVRSTILSAIGFLCLCIGACGDKAESTSSIPSDGIFGDEGTELYDMMLDVEQVNEDIIAFKKDSHVKDAKDFNELGSEIQKYRDGMKELEDKLKEKSNALKQKAEETAAKQSGKQVNVKLEEGFPAKISRAFTLTAMDFNGHLRALIYGELTLTKPCRRMDIFGFSPNSWISIKALCQNKKDSTVQDAPCNVKLNLSDNVDELPVGHVISVGIIISEIPEKVKARVENGTSIFQFDHFVLELSDENVQFTGDGESANSGSTFVIGNGKLGPLSKGMAVSSVPKSVPGLYDSCKPESEDVASEGDEWTEEFIQFYKGGKKIFRGYTNEGKISTFKLYEGSSFIKTPDGFHVGSPAREVTIKLGLSWEYFYDELPSAEKNKIHYRLKWEDFSTDDPRSAKDIKASATIREIDY